MNQKRPVFVVPLGAKITQPIEIPVRDGNTIIQKLALAEQANEPMAISVEDKDLQFIVETLDKVDCWPVLLFGLKGAEYSRIWQLTRSRNESVEAANLDAWILTYQDRFDDSHIKFDLDINPLAAISPLSHAKILGQLPKPKEHQAEQFTNTSED